MKIFVQIVTVIVIIVISIILDGDIKNIFFRSKRNNILFDSQDYKE